MNKFLEALKEEANTTTTLNGAKAYESTTSALLDLFGKGGGCRYNLGLFKTLFLEALKEDLAGAVKILFYLRDVRGGQGERTIFKAGLMILLDKYGDKIDLGKLVEAVAFYGRWDDLIILPLGDTHQYYKSIAPLLKRQLKEDLASGHPSLLAKWLPSENASNIEKKKIAGILAKYLTSGNRATYRKMLSKLRKKIRIVETNLTNKEYTFDYSKLPSKAQLKYRQAFMRNDEVRYEHFLSNVKKGEAKINTSTLYTYDVIRALKQGSETAQILWDNLADFTDGQNAIVVADTSGSMCGFPMEVSTSLAIYFAERNKGAFHNVYISFSNNPKIHHLKDTDSLSEKYNKLLKTDWGMNTDLNKVFKLILDLAVTSKAKQDELPSTIYIISDMEFDECINDGKNERLYQAAKKDFENAGYKIPHVVFWNCSSLSGQVPVRANEIGVTLISGSSQNSFRYAVEGVNPLEFMFSVINSDRYKLAGEVMKTIDN